MIGVSMPDSDTNKLWSEISWQVINFIFTIVCIWKSPQRFKLLLALARHAYEEEIDGEVRSLLSPGVLLKRSEIMIVALLRGVNIAGQYFMSFFMWGYLSRCLQQEIDLKEDCTSRPPWHVVFLVLGM